MERYLFRGLRTDGEGWVYGLFINNPESNRTKMIYWKEENGSMMGYNATVIPETVGQWTGLTDKNGVKIFEGDVVIVNHLDAVQYTGVVEYCNPVCAFKVSDHGYYNDFEVDFDYEVIGNVHEANNEK